MAILLILLAGACLCVAGVLCDGRVVNLDQYQLFDRPCWKPGCKLVARWRRETYDNLCDHWYGMGDYCEEHLEANSREKLKVVYMLLTAVLVLGMAAFGCWYWRGWF